MKKITTKNRMNKKWICLVACMLMCNLHVVMAEVSTTPEADFNFTTANDEATINYYQGTDGGAIVIPSTLGGNPVVAIADNAFTGLTDRNSNAANCKKITSVVIPNSVKSIGENAFSWIDELVSVEMPHSVETMGASPFAANFKLTTFVVPDGDDNTNYQAIYNVLYKNSYMDGNQKQTVPCGRLVNYPVGLTETEYTIRSSVKTIRAYAFYNDATLEKINIPEGVIRIEEGAFCDTEIECVTIPSSVTSIATIAFHKCAELDSVRFAGNLIVDIAADAFDGVKDDACGYFGPDNITNWTHGAQIGTGLTMLGSYYTNFDADEGVVTPTQKVYQLQKADVTYGELPTPTRDDYSFDGWFVDEIEITSESVVPVGERTLVAKWSEKTPTAINSTSEAVPFVRIGNVLQFDSKQQISVFSAGGTLLFSDLVESYELPLCNVCFLHVNQGVFKLIRNK